MGFKELTAATAVTRQALLDHPIYRGVDTPQALVTFMRLHAFAVWDFMSLLKALQRRLTGIDIPWTPSAHPTAARLVNEIVLSEESDEVRPGEFMSHFELYLCAMREVGATPEAITSLVHATQAKDAASVRRILAASPAGEFVTHTLTTATEARVHEIAASFVLGREDVIPEMFRRLLSRIENQGGKRCDSFRLYLERHIHLDEKNHAPMGQALLEELCGTDPQKWHEAAEAALAALERRRRLWDTVLREIQNS